MTSLQDSERRLLTALAGAVRELLGEQAKANVDREEVQFWLELLNDVYDAEQAVEEVRGG